MRPVQLLALLLAAGCAQAPAQNNQAGAPGPAAQPDPVMSAGASQDAVMDRIERQVQLPAGASALASYARYYAWREEGGVRSVVAVYDRLSGAQAGGRHWVAERELPVIMDGGCGVVTFSYELATQRITHIACNGDA